MTDELPPALRDLGEQLRAAAARENEVERRVERRLRRGRWRRWPLAVVAGLVSVGGVAVADRLAGGRGDDVEPDRVPRAGAPAADSGIIATSATSDPDGGPPWALRVFTNAAGEDCITVGRLMDGTLGMYDDTRTFHALPRRVVGACEAVGDTGLLVAAQIRGQPLPRTIVYGLARDRRPVRITIGGRTTTLRPGALGSFIDLRVGILNLRGAEVATTAGGRPLRRRLG